MKSDEKKTSESYRLVCEENKEVMEVSGFILCFLIRNYRTNRPVCELKCLVNKHYFTIVNLMQRCRKS